MKTTYLLAILVALALPVDRVSAADDYPTKPIRFVVSAAAGTTVDIRARQVADRITKTMGQPVLIENRPGAGGTIAAAYVAKSPADGYTVLVGSVADQAVAPAVYSKLPYDPRKDFAPITQYAETAPVLVVNPTLGVNSMDELIVLAKAKPGGLTCASYGNGTLTQLLVLQLNKTAGIQLTHVPYKNAAQALTDVVGGQISMMWDFPVTSGEFIKAGKLKAVVVVGDRRVKPLPDVPSAAELGLAPLKHKAWAGFLAPAGTPNEIVRRLNREIAGALHTPDLERIVEDNGSRVVTNSPDAFAVFIRREQDELAVMAKELGAQAD